MGAECELYRLFKNEADIMAFIWCLKSIGEINVQNDIKKATTNTEVQNFGAASLKSHIFIHLVLFITKVNYVYPQDEISNLEAELNQIFGVINEKIDQFKEKLAQKTKDSLANTLKDGGVI